MRNSQKKQTKIPYKHPHFPEGAWREITSTRGRDYAAEPSTGNHIYRALAPRPPRVVISIDPTWRRHTHGRLTSRTWLVLRRSARAAPPASRPTRPRMRSRAPVGRVATNLRRRALGAPSAGDGPGRGGDAVSSASAEDVVPRSAHSATCVAPADFATSRARQLWSEYRDVGGHECRLLVYPRGDSQALPGYVSVYLQVNAPRISPPRAEQLGVLRLLRALGA